MNTQILTEGLRALVPSDFNWQFALYAASRSRDGIALEWNFCKMANIAPWVETVRQALLKKPVAERPVAPYSPLLHDKENIAAISADDELMRQQILEIQADIKSAHTRDSEDFVSGAVPKPTGYAFYALDGAGNPILLLRRSNPFLTGASRLCVAVGDGLADTDKPVIKLAPTADFLLLGGNCYFFSSGVEKDFELIDRHFAIAAKRIALIDEAGVVSNIEMLEKSGLAAKNVRKFLDFDKAILEYIVKLPIAEREEFLLTYGVTLDRNGNMDTADEEQCVLIIDLLCCRSCLDPLGRLAVGNNITVRQ